MYSFLNKEKAKATEIHLKILEQEDTFADLASGIPRNRTTD